MYVTAPCKLDACSCCGCCCVMLVDDSLAVLLTKDCVLAAAVVGVDEAVVAGVDESAGVDGTEKLP